MADSNHSPFRTLAAKHVELRASMLALRIWIAESREETKGVPIEDTLCELESLSKKMHRQLLIEIEKEDPEIAALLDQRSMKEAADAEEDADA